MTFTSNFTGIQNRTSKRGSDYIGSIHVYKNGRYLWSRSCTIRRLYRGDALRDAQQMSHDVTPITLEG